MNRMWQWAVTLVYLNNKHTFTDIYPNLLTISFKMNFLKISNLPCFSCHSLYLGITLKDSQTLRETYIHIYNMYVHICICIYVPTQIHKYIYTKSNYFDCRWPHVKKHAGTYYLHPFLKADAWEKWARWREKHRI